MPSNNCDYPSANLDRQRGFTLIELLITVAIIGIIASVGWSYYDAQKRRGYRSEAVIALTTLAQMEERHMTLNGSYANAISTLNPPSSVLTSSNMTPNHNVYTLSIIIPAAPANCTVNGNYYCYQIKATATGSQAKDTKCADLYLDQAGRRWSTDDKGTVTTGCWSK